MLLIIAHHHDREAEWLYNSWKENYLLPVRLLTPETLGLDYDISLHLDNDGQHRASICFYQTGETIDCDNVRYAVNRLSYIDPILWQKSPAGEKLYATSEINAFFPAFIHALGCPLSNLIYNGALYGEAGFDTKWRRYLHEEGIAISPMDGEGQEPIYERITRIPAHRIYRVLHAHGAILLPPAQHPCKSFAHIAASILQICSPETLEFVFILEEDEEPVLLFVSKAPALSCYGKRYTEMLFQQIAQHYDNIDGDTERNALAIAG